jgi:hypothetical protein
VKHPGLLVTWTGLVPFAFITQISPPSVPVPQVTWPLTPALATVVE